MAYPISSFVDTVKTELPQFTSRIMEIQEFAHSKLWHELTVNSVELLRDPSFAPLALLFHDQVLRPTREYCNPYSYARMVLLICNSIHDAAAVVEFLSACAVTPEKEANLSLRCEEAAVRLSRLQDSAMSAVVVKEISEYLSKVESKDVHALLHMGYNRLRAVVAWDCKDYDDFYSSVFQYLAYCDAESTLPAVEVDTLAVRLAVSALTSRKLHNFGEFISNSVVTNALEGSHDWLLQFLHAFNDGNVERFEGVLSKHKDEFEKIDALKSTAPLLLRKFQLMALLHLVFYTPVWNRTFTLHQMAERVHVSDKEVEILLLKAFALGLLRGSIDDVDTTVTIGYVQPRVLQLKELPSFTESLTVWAERATQTERGMSSYLERLHMTHIE